MRVLAIESSCDETAAAVVRDDGEFVRVESSIVASQAALHERTNGVVPEVAARAHVEAITFVIEDAVVEAVGSRQKAVETIDAVAVTTEPGLKPALVIGETAARALAVAWGKRLIPIHHIAGHIAAAWLPLETGNLRLETGERVATHRFPAIALVVSGGHTQLYRVDTGLQLRLLGETRDDAAGEAFDKIARLLGLPYPGGPALARLAERGDACAYAFPRPMIHSGDEAFSFSGLKTAVYYMLRGSRQQAVGSRELDEQFRRDVAASAQEAIVDVLVDKTVAAAAREGAQEVMLTGGVAANERLRQKLRTALGELPLVVPLPRFCTDNAAMIGAAAVLGVQVPKKETAPQS